MGIFLLYVLYVRAVMLTVLFSVDLQVCVDGKCVLLYCSHDTEQQCALFSPLVMDSSVR